MKDLTEQLLSRPRLTLGAAVLLSLVGLYAWTSMPRVEDPQMPGRWALLVTPYPGADPFTIERTVVEPLERALSEVEEIAHVMFTVRTGVAVGNLQLADSTRADEISRIWDDVEDAMARARREMPEGALAATLDRDISDPDSVVLALTGADALVLAEAADRVERRLLAQRGVARVRRIGDPGSQVTIAVDQAAARQLGVTTRSLAQLLGARELTIPAGSIDVQGRTATLRPEAEYHSVQEIAETPVPLPSGAAVPLSQIADVYLGPEEPASERMRFAGQRAVGLGVVPAFPVDLVQFGHDVRAVLAELRPDLEGVRLSEVTYQPARVEERLGELGGSLFYGMAIVAGILFVAMGLRLGLVVSAVVPLVAATSLGLYAAFGGVLHQMSIAALVIALGMLVDNAIVVAENVQARLDAGETRLSATVAAARELALPLGAATGTTVAAFIPLLLAQSPTADFTRALPVLISLTLIVSYLFALFVTPSLARLLEPRVADANAPPREPLGGVARALGGFAVRRRRWVLLAGLLLVGGSVALAGRVEQQFFPGSDRNQLLVTLQLAEGTDLDRTDSATSELERALAARPEAQSVASFIGRGAPHFYYNIIDVPHTPHQAQLLVTTTDVEAAGRLQRWVREWVGRELPEAIVVARKLEQGPPVSAPVEVRLYGESLADLARASDTVASAVAGMAGTRDVRSSLGTGVPSLRVRVDDASAARLGLSRSDVVLSLLGQTQGLPVGQLRSGDDPVPILLRAPEGRHTSVDQLASVAVSDARGDHSAPLAAMARTETVWQPGAIRRRDRSRLASVLAELDDDTTFTAVERQLRPTLATLQLPRGVRWELGGAGEGSADANRALLTSIPLGLLLLFGILLVEFNSYRRVAVVLTTLPLAAAGVVPGLLLGDQPFGFMSMLGVIALCGVVVNNAIVLLDVADRLQREGMGLEQATAQAVTERARPIVLTTLTTVAGLVPLALSPTPLWPPLAWAMISGLLASSALTLLVVPALYVTALTPRPLLRRLMPAAATSAVLLAALPGQAQDSTEPFDLAVVLAEAGPTLRLDEVVARALEHAPRARAATARSAAAQARVEASEAALWPSVDLSARYTRLNRIDSDPLIDPGAIDAARMGIGEVQDPAAAELFTGIVDSLEAAGASRFSSPPNQTELTASLTLPLTDTPLRLMRQKRAAEAEQRAAEHMAESVFDEVALQARLAYYRYARALGGHAVAQRAVEQAVAQLARIEQLVAAGSASEADRMAALARLEGVRAQRARLAGSVRTARVALWTLLGEPDRPLGVIEVSRPDLEASAKRETLVQRALDQRPELKATRQARQAQGQAELAERAAMWPRLLAQANVTYANPNLRYLPPEETFRTSWDVSAVLSWSPSQATIAKRRAEALATDQLATRAELDAMADDVRIQVTRAYEDFQAAREASEAARAAQRAAEEAYRVRRVQLDAGAAMITDVLEADLDVTRARLTFLQAALDLREAYAQLQRAVGGAP